MTRKMKAYRKTALLIGAVSGASLLIPLGSKDAHAQSYSCESGGALQDSGEITGCAVISYGLTPPEEFGLAVPADTPPAVNAPTDTGGTYTI